MQLIMHGRVFKMETTDLYSPGKAGQGAARQGSERQSKEVTLLQKGNILKMMKGGKNNEENRIQSN